MVSLARPLLADSEFVNKARTGRRDDINTCIACNQACLDHAFRVELATCLVNPRAGRETELIFQATRLLKAKRIAVVGAGPAGLAAATSLTERGHEVHFTKPGASPTLNLHDWLAEWGVADPAQARGGVVRAQPAAQAHRITLLQRKAGRLGKGLGKTTAWVHRAALQMKQVQMLAGVNYERITPQGLFITFGHVTPTGS